MTAAVIVPSKQGLVIAVDRRITYGSAHYDRPCVKAFVKHGLKIAAAGGLQRAQLLYSRLRDHKEATRAAREPETFFPSLYAEYEWTAEDDTTAQLLVVSGDESFHVSAEGDVIRRQPEETWTIGSGGDFIRGYLSGQLFNPLTYNGRDSVVNTVELAFAAYPFDDVSHEIDVL